VTKTFDPGSHPSPGLHRYDVAQGFQPLVTRLAGRSAEEVLALACERMRGRPARSWSSADAEDWRGPPAVWFSWD